MSSLSITSLRQRVVGSEAVAAGWGTRGDIRPGGTLQGIAFNTQYFQKFRKQ